MAYNTDLEHRIDRLITGWDLKLEKRRMFGGVSYFVNGNMCFAVLGDELLLRVGSDETGGLLDKPGMHAAEMGKRVMKNWLQAGGKAILHDVNLHKLLAIGRNYALKLPPKHQSKSGLS